MRVIKFELMLEKVRNYPFIHAGTCILTHLYRAHLRAHTQISARSIARTRFFWFLQIYLLQHHNFLLVHFFFIFFSACYFEIHPFFVLVTIYVHMIQIYISATSQHINIQFTKPDSVIRM